MVSELGCLWSGGLTSFSSTVGPSPARRLCESFFIQTYRQIDRQTDRSTYQARMLILSCFCNQDIFIIITTPLYGFLPTLAAILAILRASSLSDGERERQREQEEQYILKSMMTKSERERERERERKRERENEREREREREREYHGNVTSTSAQS